jgi:hypothetical protein
MSEIILLIEAMPSRIQSFLPKEGSHQRIDPVQIRFLLFIMDFYKLYYRKSTSIVSKTILKDQTRLAKH